MGYWVRPQVAVDDLRPGHGVANRTQDIVTGVHFILRVAGQGDAQRIADAFQQQAANPHAGFDQQPMRLPPASVTPTCRG